MSLARTLLAKLREVEVSGTRTAQAVQFLKDFSQRPEMLAEFAPPTAAELRAHAAATGTYLGGVLVPTASPATPAPAAPVQVPAAPGTPRMIRTADGALVHAPCICLRGANRLPIVQDLS